ncbi:MAG: hypothetical protein JRN52_03015 [Nitrososphaerota archaeon]|nr:hypothetical protein [Nitrososphaerota archaeon]
MSKVALAKMVTKVVLDDESFPLEETTQPLTTKRNPLVSLAPILPKSDILIF